MLLCLLVSPSSASARCHHRSSEDCHRRPCRAAQSSSGAWRWRQAGTRRWMTGFQVQGRTGTGTGSCQGAMLVARQHRPWYMCMPVCTEHHQLHSVFWEGVRGPAAERCPGMGMPVATRLLAAWCSRPWLGFLMGFAANVLTGAAGKQRCLWSRRRRTLGLQRHGSPGAGGVIWGRCQPDAPVTGAAWPAVLGVVQTTWRSRA